MAFGFQAVTTTADYADASTLGPGENFESITFSVHNATVQMQVWEPGGPLSAATGSWTNEQLVTPGSGMLTRCGGVRFRDNPNTAGTHGIVSAAGFKTGQAVIVPTGENTLTQTAGGGTSTGSGGPATIADGADVAEGARADAAWGGVGNATVIAALKAIWAKVQTPALTCGSVYDDSGNLCTIKVAVANVAASQTDSAVVAAVANKHIRVIAYVVECGGTATTVVFNSKPAGAGSAISPTYQNGANGGVAENAGPNGWCFQSATGEGLSVTTGAGSQTGVRVTYIEAA